LKVETFSTRTFPAVQMSARGVFWTRVFKCFGCIAGWDHKPDCPKGRRAHK
jgi:hypothetical protein